VQFTVNTDLGPNIGKSARQNIAWLSLKLKYHHALYVTRWATDTQQAARKFELWCLTYYAGISKWSKEGRGEHFNGSQRYSNEACGSIMPDSDERAGKPITRHIAGVPIPFRFLNRAMHTGIPILIWNMYGGILPRH
jgi:hypothetical protein